VRFLERGAPPSERLALERKVRLPRVERVFLDLLPGLGDARVEIGIDVGAEVSRADVAAVDQDERSGAPWKPPRE
jgi:hypothetical protein